MPPPGKGRYFLALIPPSPVREELGLLKAYFKDHYRSKASLNSPPHITLHMPFEWPEKKESVLLESLIRFAGLHRPFEVQLSGFGSFAPRVIFVRVEASHALRDVQRQLHNFCKRELNVFNAGYRDLPFQPHVTVAFRDLKKAAFAPAWEEFKEKPFQADFLATGITLLKHDGRTWQPLRDFDFAAANQP